jgi:hypothetical protein
MVSSIAMWSTFFSIFFFAFKLLLTAEPILSHLFAKPGDAQNVSSVSFAHVILGVIKHPK